MPKKEIYKCAACGAELTDNNCRPNSKNYCGLSAYCLDCEEHRFAELKEAQGVYMALFSACVAYDVPLIPLVLDGIDLEAIDKPWGAYLDRLVEKNELFTNDGIKCFTDGVTTLWQLFGNEQKYTDFNARIRMERDKIKKERERLAKLDGTPQQRERWGTGDLYRSPNPKLPTLKLTTEVYNDLDRLYENRAQTLKGQTITPQIEFTLQEVAKSTVIFTFQRRYGERDADKTYKTLEAMLASESLRKKDEKPIANFTPDVWIDALEKAGVMQDGQFLPLNEITDAMIKIMRGKGYKQTLDCAHQLEMNIINNARKNADQQTIYELPSDMRITDELDEFAQEADEDEKEVREKAHLTTVRFEGDSETEKTKKKGKGKNAKD